MAADLNLSPINANLLKNRQNINNQNDISAQAQNKNPNRIDKKKLACTIAAAVGVAALAAVIIHNVRKGKSKDIADDGQQIVENIKQFFNKDNELVEGVTLKKGKAVASDGSMFSGIMNTTNKKGEKIAIEYQDGFMISSSKNGKLFKKFGNITIPAQDGKAVQTLTRNQGTKIIKYNDEGKFDSMSEIIYNANGKVKRFVNETQATDFFPNGKIQAKETRSLFRWAKKDGNIPQSLGDYTGMTSAKLYNQDGILTDEIINNFSNAERKIIKHLPDGSKAEMSKVGYLNNKRPPSTALVSEVKYDSPRAKIFDTDGKLIKIVKQDVRPKDLCLYIEDCHANSNLQVDMDAKEISGVIGGRTGFGFDMSNGKFSIIERDNQIRNYSPKEKEAKLKQCIEFVKKEISVARELGIKDADKISEQLPEFLETNCKVV